RVRRRDLRRNHDNAGPAARAGRKQYRPDRGRPHHRVVLGIAMDAAAVKQWRRGERERLIAWRVAVPAAQRRRWGADIEKTLRKVLQTRPGPLGVYWPFRAEFDPRQLVEWTVADGRTVALPVVVDKK